MFSGGAGEGSPVGLSTPYHRGLVGCIGNVRIDEQRLNMFDDIFGEPASKPVLSYCGS
jgi:hypothetical protein